ncbi:hypothetical protein PLICRDRAFT_227972 [Plicaturopsis crispa FD-325 SS-3]|nr:hypothetical protein PLICRDRAFT_227972 [Plicaturopsis crispa FD-325 SS-3]
MNRSFRTYFVSTEVLVLPGRIRNNGMYNACAGRSRYYSLQDDAIPFTTTQFPSRTGEVPLNCPPSPCTPSRPCAATAPPPPCRFWTQQSRSCTLSRPPRASRTRPRSAAPPPPSSRASPPRRTPGRTVTRPSRSPRASFGSSSRSSTGCTRPRPCRPPWSTTSAASSRCSGAWHTRCTGSRGGMSWRGSC